MTAESTDRLWERAQRYLVGRQIAAAQATLELLLTHDPAHTRAHLTLGGIAWKEDRMRDAIRHALDAARTPPADADLLCDIVAALVQVGEVVAARACMDHPLLASTKSIPTLMRLSGQCQMLGEHPRALALLDRAKAAGITGADFHCYRGVQLTFNGHLKEAEVELETCVRLNPAAGRASLMLARLHRQTPQHNHLSALTNGLRTVAKGSEEHAALEFARYKELEDLQRYDEAWDALTRGNAIMYARLGHDPERERNLLDGMLERCSRQFLHSEDATHDGPQPIFILGMPRSGTTLLDRIFGNHSQVTSAGELGDFGRQLRWAADHCCNLIPDQRLLDRLTGLDYAELGRRYLAQSQWRAGGKPFYVDKLPAHWSVAGLILRALPQARILHLTRDPMDVCFSNWRAMFGESYPYSYDLSALALHYLQYRRVMAHWHAAMPERILDVPYRDLVSSPEAMARKALGFCGLEYQPGCVDIKRNKDVVATLSMAQVRESIHQRSFEEWRRYERQLAPLRDAVTN